MYWEVKAIFLAFDFCRFCVIIRFFHPRHNGQWPPTSKDFHPRSYPLHFLSYLYSSKRASISLFQFWVLKKGTTGTIFKTSLVWRGPWLGIEPGSSRTRNQHSTTRLSMRLNLPSDLFVYQQNVCFNMELNYRCVKRSSNHSEINIKSKLHKHVWQFWHSELKQQTSFYL